MNLKEGLAFIEKELSPKQSESSLNISFFDDN